MVEPGVMLSSFYDALDALGSPVPLAGLTLGGLPNRGVYFFFEDGETRDDGRPRVVRVGTHALSAGSKSTLRGRLAQHRGSARGGNHRGSIFRLLVGQALLDRHSHIRCHSWGMKGQRRLAAAALGDDSRTLRASETPLEQRVSDVIGRMSVAVLAVDDEPGPNSMRGYFERNAIALLSSAYRNGIASASPDWLGRHSNRPLVPASGLWNQRHVGEAVDRDFIDRLNIAATA